MMGVLERAILGLLSAGVVALVGQVIRMSISNAREVQRLVTLEADIHAIEETLTRVWSGLSRTETTLARIEAKLEKD